jgi:hypothetical protein
MLLNVAFHWFLPYPEVQFAGEKCLIPVECSFYHGNQWAG